MKIKNILFALAASFTAAVSTPATAQQVATNPQIQCLARNAYFEAGNQGRQGMIAVSNVVMNRSRDHRFPSTPCGVINQRWRGTCQFSWVCGRQRIRNQAIFSRALEVAADVYNGRVGDLTNGARFYHAVYVNPRWRYTRVARIGDHIFYRG